MNCFLVKMVFQIICGNGDHTPQFDAQLRLIFAQDAAAAVVKAKEQAANESTDTAMVKWKLIAVTDIYPFSENLDGALLFSAITEYELKEPMIEALQLKEKDLQALCHTIYS